MSELKNSAFLVSLLKRARSVMVANHGKVLSAEYVIVTALGCCTEAGLKLKEALPAEEAEECGRMVWILTQHFPQPQQTADRILYMLAGGKGQSNNYKDGIALQKILFAAAEVAQKEQKSAITADILIQCILRDPNQRIMSYVTGDLEGNPAPVPKTKPDADGDTIDPVPTPVPKKSVTIPGAKPPPQPGKDPLRISWPGSG